MKVHSRLSVPIPSALTAFAVTLLLLMAILSLTPLLGAQSFYGSVIGTVMDSSGAVVPDATVKVTNIGTNASQSAQTDSGGKYSFVNLVPADYRVEVTKGNFKRFVRERVPVQVGAVIRIDSTLAVGNVSETVEVSTATPLLQTDSSTMGQEIEGAEVQQIPLNGRNVMNLIALAPGVVATGGASGGTGLNQGNRTAGGAGWGNYEIGGSIQGQSGQYIDGVANNILGNNIVALVPTQDAVQEFNVASSNAGADFGRFSGGVVNMTTKSGSNTFHGSAWEYLRNTDFNANDWFSIQQGSARPEWNQNQYGAEATGPIKRDKAFFMFTWENFKAITGIVVPTNVPTAGMQTGVIPEVYAGGVLQNDNVIDPLGNCNITHQAGNSGSPGTWTITNLYQGACGDPLNKILKTFYPLPNTSGSSNWFLTTPLESQQKQYNARVDYNISQRNRFFSRYTYWLPADTAHDEFNDVGYSNATGQDGTTWPTHDSAASYLTHQAVLGDTYTINTTTVLDVRVNYVRQFYHNPAEGTSVNEAQFGADYAALAPQMVLHNMPGFNASGLHNLYQMQNYPNDSNNWYNTYGVSANLVKIVGPHSLKFGAELRLMDGSSINYNGGAAGTYNYGQNSSGGDAGGKGGDEWASFLMGYTTQATFKTTQAVAPYTYYQGYYVTDTWQAAHNLTLNLGLRYELPGAIAERNNKSTVLLPNTVDPLTGITGTEALVASSLYPGRTTVVPQHNLFAPRLGFAYRLTASTVFRGGYGISYLPNDVNNVYNVGNSYINGATTQVNVTGLTPTPLQTILNGIVASGIKPTLGRGNGQPTYFMPNLGSETAYLGQNIVSPLPYQSYPYVQEWNFSGSHQFKGDWMAELGYAALKGTNMPGSGNFSGGRNLDQLPDQYDSMGATLGTKQACANASGLVMSVGQCLKPYPYYNGFVDYAQFDSRSNYRSLQAKAEKRMGAAGVLMANYTWAQNRANTDTQTSYVERKPTKQGGSGTGAIQDYNNLAGEYSLISYDVTNRAIVSYVLNLPFGKGQKFGNSFSGAMNEIVSGWAVNGVTTSQSGFPVFFYMAQSNQLQSNYGAGQTRPNKVPGCNPVIGGSGLARAIAGAWFNTACFVYPGDYTFGNEPRVDPQVRADGVKNFDFSFQKSTSIHESTNFEFRAEFFNIFNRVQFAPPIPQVGSVNFGQVTYQVNTPRQIQLSARVNF